MRALKSLLFLYLLSGASVGVAAQQSINLDTDFRLTNTSRVIADGSTDKSSTTDSLQTLTYKATNLPQHGTFQGALSTELPDYSQEKLAQADGSFVKLGEKYPKGHVRAIGSASGTLGLGSASTLGANVSGTLNKTPYQFVGGGLSFTQSLYSQSTFLNLAANIAQDNSPASVFITPGAYFAQRNPTQVDAREMLFGVEQIFGERWKAAVTVNTGRKLQSRPQYYGVKSKAAVALEGGMFLQGNLQYARDSRADPLKSELGYMSKFQSEALFTIEPIYDLLVSASYGLVQETVDDPRNLKLLRSRAHQVGLGSSWDLGTFEPQLRCAYVVAASDKNTNQFQVGGGLTWSF